jgi:hypothetical protein
MRILFVVETNFSSFVLLEVIQPPNCVCVWGGGGGVAGGCNEPKGLNLFSLEFLLSWVDLASFGVFCNGVVEVSVLPLFDTVSWGNPVMHCQNVENCNPHEVMLLKHLFTNITMQLLSRLRKQSDTLP